MAAWAWGAEVVHADGGGDCAVEESGNWGIVNGVLLGRVDWMPLERIAPIHVARLEHVS